MKEALLHTKARAQGLASKVNSPQLAQKAQDSKMEALQMDKQTHFFGERPKMQALQMDKSTQSLRGFPALNFSAALAGPRVLDGSQGRARSGLWARGAS